MKIIRSSQFDQWLHSLRSPVWQSRITARLEQIVKFDHFGDCKYLADGVSELRFKSGAGYRIYYGKRGQTVVILLCAGDKSSQKKDIEQAIALLRQFEQASTGDKS